MSKDNWAIFFLIFFLALIVGGFYLKFMPVFPLEGDALHYDLIAQNLAKGKGFVLEEGVPISDRFPGYPFFLALVYKIFGHNLNAVRIIQIFILAGIGLLIYLIARRHLELSQNISALAAGLVVVWPYFVFYTTLILTEILFIFFLSFSLYFLLKFRQEKTYKSGVISGALLGTTMLIRYTVLFLPIWLAIFLYISLKFKKEVFEWKKIAVFLLMAFIVIVPWIIRNSIQEEKFILGNAVLGSLPRAFIHYDYRQDSNTSGPGGVNLKMAVLSKLENIYFFWNPGTQGERAQILLEKYSWANNLILAYKILFFIILGAAFLSLRFIKKKEVYFLWAVIFYFWALHTVLYPYPRYTLPVIPFIILLAAISLNSLFIFLRQKFKKFSLPS